MLGVVHKSHHLRKGGAKRHKDDKTWSCSIVSQGNRDIRECLSTGCFKKSAHFGFANFSASKTS